MPSQDAEASSQPVEDTAWVPNQAVSLTHLGMHPPLEGLGTHLPLNSAPQMASQMLTQPFHGDPLLRELDRVQKEKEKTIMIHEEAVSFFFVNVGYLICWLLALSLTSCFL